MLINYFPSCQRLYVGLGSVCLATCPSDVLPCLHIDWKSSDSSGCWKCDFLVMISYFYDTIGFESPVIFLYRYIVSMNIVTTRTKNKLACNIYVKCPLEGRVFKIARGEMFQCPTIQLTAKVYRKVCVSLSFLALGPARLITSCNPSPLHYWLFCYGCSLSLFPSWVQYGTALVLR